MKAYRYRDGRNGRVDAAVVRREFEKIKRRGALTPRAIVDEAVNKENPIHPLFTWDKEALRRSVSSGAGPQAYPGCGCCRRG